MVPVDSSIMLPFLQEFVPLDTQMQFGNSKEHIRILTDATLRIRNVAERIAERDTEYALDMMVLNKAMR
jgi:hypothetical protein